MKSPRNAKTFLVKAHTVTVKISFRLYISEFYYRLGPVINIEQPSENTHQYNNIHSSLHQQVQSVFVVLPGADGGAAQQLFA